MTGPISLATTNAIIEALEVSAELPPEYGDDDDSGNRWFNDVINDHAEAILRDLCAAAAKDGRIKLVVADIATYLDPERFVTAVMPPRAS